MNKLSYFEELAEKGFSLVRLNGKIPVENNWTKYCVNKRNFDEIGFRSSDNAGIACGPASGIIVIDVDDISLFETVSQNNGWLSPETLTVETGGDGLHYYFKYPDNGSKYGNRSFKEQGFDIRGNGGQVVSPASIHPDTNKEYQIIKGDIDTIAPCPEWVLKLYDNTPEPTPIFQKPITKPDLDSLKVSEKIKEHIRNGKPEGERSEPMMSVIDSLVRAGNSDELIIEIFDSYPIGEKYHEKGNTKASWLKSQIEKAKDYVSSMNNRKSAEKVNENTLRFPYHIMGGVAYEFASLYSEYLESPIEFFYISFLTCLGCILADKLTIDSEIKPQPRLYVLLLGQSADDRKSTAIIKTLEIFDGDIACCLGVNSAEGLQKQLEERNKLLLCFDEFKLFINKCSIQSSVLLPCVNTLFESNGYESHTKTSSFRIDDALLSMLSASTVDTYERTWDSSFTDIGFNNRLFIVPATGKKKYAIPPNIPETEKKNIREQINKILWNVKDRLELPITPEAKIRFEKWYKNLQNSIHARRIDTYALRFMSLLAVNESKNEIDVDIVQKTIQLMDWQLKVRQLYDPIDADTIMAKMEERIRRQLSSRGPLPERELRRRTGADRAGLWFFDKAKENLKKSGDIRWDKTVRKWELADQE
ncbi:bifunctional DNA primase/polymerase [Candidatus Omnitrophota bacterium]